MTDSIICNEKRCFVCGKEDPICVHHCLHGWGRRQKADLYGCWVYLCPDCHTGPRGVHFNKQLDKKLKEISQTAWEERYGSRQAFINEFGRSYL